MLIIIMVINNKGNCNGNVRGNCNCNGSGSGKGNGNCNGNDNRMICSNFKYKYINKQWFG